MPTRVGFQPWVSALHYFTEMLSGSELGPQLPVGVHPPAFERRPEVQALLLRGCRVQRIYIYIYTYVSTCIYIHIYIYVYVSEFVYKEQLAG